MRSLFQRLVRRHALACGERKIDAIRSLAIFPGS